MYKLFVVIGGICGAFSKNIFYVIHLGAMLGMFYIYTKYCKSNWILKNLFTAFASTTVVFIPILCGGEVNMKIIGLSGVAFSFTLGREVFMDIRDRKGDQIIINVKRPPIAFGYAMS